MNRQTDIGGIERQVDLAVNGGLWVLVVVLVYLWGRLGYHGGYSAGLGVAQGHCEEVVEGGSEQQAGVGV